MAVNHSCDGSNPSTGTPRNNNRKLHVMKKILTAVLIVTAFSVSACGGGDEPAPRETASVSQSPSAAAGEFSVQENEYLDDVIDYMTPALANELEEDVVAFGYLACDEFERGTTVEELVDMAADSGISPTDVRVMSASAAANFCPDFQDGL